MILRILNNDMSVRWLNAVFKTDLTHIYAQFSYEDPLEKQKKLYVSNKKKLVFILKSKNRGPENCLIKKSNQGLREKVQFNSHAFGWDS